MNPYEKTAQAMKKQSEGPKRFASNALGIGLGVGASSFAPILARAAPFLSEYIPENLAIKGLSKISPKFGKFIQSALGDGYDFKEVKDFIGDQINESKSEPAKENGNIIEQYSPELHKFIDEQLKRGRSALEAGAIAQNDKRFSEAVKKITKDHKAPWSSILESVYGNAQMAQKTQPEAQQATQMGQNQQAGQGQQALMSILQKIQAARGAGS